MALLLRSFSSSLLNLPALSFADAEEIAVANSSINKRVKGYKFFHEKYIHRYQVCEKQHARKPKTMGRRYLHSTLYRAYTGPLPDPDILASGEKLRQLESQPLIALVLDGLSHLELVPSKFGPVPQGSLMSYQCPPEKSSGSIILHHMAPDFPSLPLMLHRLPNMCFVPTLGQLMHLHSLQVSLKMSYEIEARTREQSRCPYDL